MLTVPDGETGLSIFAQYSDSIKGSFAVLYGSVGMRSGSWAIARKIFRYRYRYSAYLGDEMTFKNTCVRQKYLYLILRCVSNDLQNLAG